jgi:hypothetical protein
LIPRHEEFDESAPPGHQLGRAVRLGSLACLLAGVVAWLLPNPQGEALVEAARYAFFGLGGIGLLASVKLLAGRTWAPAEWAQAEDDVDPERAAFDRHADRVLLGTGLGISAHLLLLAFVVGPVARSLGVGDGWVIPTLAGSAFLWALILNTTPGGRAILGAIGWGIGPFKNLGAPAALPAVLTGIVFLVTLVHAACG